MFGLGAPPTRRFAPPCAQAAMRIGLADCPVRGRKLTLVVHLRLRDPVDQTRDQRNQRRQEPEPPPERTRNPFHHLVAAEAAVPVERSCDSSAAATLVELETAVGTP
jgi:hypothetical protein